MLFLRRVIIIGGDKRSRYLNQYLCDAGFSTYCFGLSPGEQLWQLAEALRGDYVAVILPLPLSKDGIHVHMPLTSCSLPLDFLRGKLRPDIPVFGGMFPKHFSEQLLADGIRFTDYYDEEVIVRNAVLTAEGTVCVLRAYTNAEIATLRFAVMGYGRVAKATVQELQAKGATVCVAARKAEALCAARHAGAQAVPLSAFLLSPGGYDVIVNTVPAQIFGRAALAKTKEDVLLIDVASAPFGFDFEAAQSLARTAIQAQSLPGKYFPQAAAQIVGEKIKSLL